MQQHLEKSLPTSQWLRQYCKIKHVYSEIFSGKDILPKRGSGLALAMLVSSYMHWFLYRYFCGGDASRNTKNVILSESSKSINCIILSTLMEPYLLTSSEDLVLGQQN